MDFFFKLWNWHGMWWETRTFLGRQNILYRCKPTCRCGYSHEIVYDVRACNMCDVKTERWRQLIFEFSFDVTHVTHVIVINNLVEMSTPASRFAPVTYISSCRYSQLWILKLNHLGGRKKLTYPIIRNPTYHAYATKKNSDRRKISTYR